MCESENVKEDEPERGRVFLAKGYPVFNVVQVEGYTPPEVPWPVVKKTK